MEFGGSGRIEQVGQFDEPTPVGYRDLVCVSNVPFSGQVIREHLRSLALDDRTVLFLHEPLEIQEHLIGRVEGIVPDPAFLVVAWRRLRGNRGARTGGLDGVTPRSLGSGAEMLLVGLRDDLKARRFVPQRVR